MSIPKINVGDTITLDGTTYKVTSRSSSTADWWLQEDAGGGSYYTMRLLSVKDALSAWNEGRLTMGSTPASGNKMGCKVHDLQLYVGARERYRFCKNCEYKESIDWREIRD